MRKRKDKEEENKIRRTRTEEIWRHKINIEKRERIDKIVEMDRGSSYLLREIRRKEVMKEEEEMEDEEIEKRGVNKRRINIISKKLKKDKGFWQKKEWKTSMEVYVKRNKKSILEGDK